MSRIPGPICGVTKPCAVKDGTMIRPGPLGRTLATPAPAHTAVNAFSGPRFHVLISETGAEAGLRQIATLDVQAAAIAAVSEELNRVARSSENAEVQRGFGVEFVRQVDLTTLKPGDFPVFLISQKQTDLAKRLVTKRLGREHDLAVAEQNRNEGGIGFGGPKPIALFSTGSIESDTLLTALTPKEQKGLGQGFLARAILHELGHSLGIRSNKASGDSIMFGDISYSRELARGRYAPDEAKTILESLVNLTKQK